MDLSTESLLGQAPTFQTAINNPIRQFAQRSAAPLRAPGFLRKNAQLMIITIFGVVFYSLCVVRITKKKEIPITLGLITTVFLLYFVQRYHKGVSTAEVAWAGWVFVAFLAAAIGSMSYWVDQDDQK